jgi:copper homeostasis protein
MIKFELCCANISSAQLAAELNIDAIELCVDLAYGGLTPSLGLIQKAREIFRGELSIFFRVRNGDFVYDDVEKNIMLHDISQAISLGIDTVVAGGLSSDGALDVDFMNRIIDVADGHTVSFHRAIDICPRPIEIIEQLIESKVTRLLSSGRQANALLGAAQLNSWIDQFGAHIEIMAGGGIRLDNTIPFLQLFKGKRFHASLRTQENPDSSLLKLGLKEEADRQQVISMLKIIKSYDL